MPKQLTPAIIKQWLDLVEGVFDIRQIWNELGIESAQGKNQLRVILFRLEHQEPPAITNLGNGKYRKIDNEKKLMDWRTASSENIISLKWPFGLEEFVAIYSKNVAIIAGSKQEGKSTFLYNFIKLNMYQYHIDLFNSETGREQMKDRFTDLGIPLDAPFEAYERYDNFADVIEPDRIAVIDYLDLNSEFYLAGAEIDRIFRKLTTGIAVIGMQIPPPTEAIIKGVKKLITRDYAYGGGTTAKRAFIYISMSGHLLKIKHAKKPAKRNVNPENMTWSYSFNGSGQFSDIKRFYGEPGLL